MPKRYIFSEPRVKSGGGATTPEEERRVCVVLTANERVLLNIYAKRVKALKINKITIILALTQWVKRILPFIFPQGKFTDPAENHLVIRIQ